VPEVDRSEKITINVGLVDLGQIDLLVDEGFFANRTDFTRRSDASWRAGQTPWRPRWPAGRSRWAAGT
jgi:hypothetical protein